MSTSIKLEGYTAEELLNLPQEVLDGFVLSTEPLAFSVGSAELLGRFRIHVETLVIELAHIEGAGEGVLPTLASLAERYASKKELKRVEWIVHAVNCGRPNLKLKRMLELKGFRVENIAGVGEAYHYLHELVQKNQQNS